MVTMAEARKLEQALRGPDEEARRQALATIGGDPPERRDWLRLAMGEPWDCAVLLGLLLGGQPRGLAVDEILAAASAALGEALGGRSPRQRHAAERALIHGNLPLKPALAALGRWMTDPRPAVRRAASHAAGAWGGYASDDLGLIDRLVLDPELFPRGVEAAAALVPRFVSLLMRILAAPRRRPSRRRWRAGQVDAWRQLGHALGYLPQLRERILKVLAENGRPSSADELRALRGTTDGCGPAIAIYLRALASADEAASNEACSALLKLQQIVDLPADEHHALVNSPILHVRANTLRCASMLRTDPPVTWGLFLNGLRDRSPEVRKATAETIARRFRDVPAELVTALARVMHRDRNGAVRMAAAHAFGHVGPPADRAAAIALLKGGLRAPERTRRVARAALDCLGG
jgi:HEAT repeat protein